MSKPRNVPTRPPARKPVPFTERAPSVEAQQTQRVNSTHARSRLVAAQSAPGVTRWVIMLVAFGLPAMALFAISMLLGADEYRLNTELFTERLVRATILALSGGAAVAMFVAVFGRGNENLPLGVKIGALVLATAALVLGLLFGVLL